MEQFIAALDTRELRLGLSQTSPNSLDEALHTALKLETLFTVEQAKASSQQQQAIQTNMASEEQVEQPQPAEVNVAGAHDLNNPPRSARELIERQNKTEKLLENSERQSRRRARRNECYRCGEEGDFQRNCPSRVVRNENQGNAARAGSYQK